VGECEAECADAIGESTQAARRCAEQQRNAAQVAKFADDDEAVVRHLRAAISCEQAAERAADVGLSTSVR